MSAIVAISRLATGVPGLDEVLGGGLPEFSFNLIAGLPGSGKTTLSNQIMFSLASEQRKALYFTVLGEPPLKMLRYQQQFSFFDSDAVNDSVRFINLSEEAAGGDLSKVLDRIVEEVEAVGPGLVFVDSFRSVDMASSANGSPVTALQQFVQQLGILMTSWQATTFLLGEYFDETDANPVFTVADGLIWLRQSVERNSMVRKLEIMKMRGQATLPGLHAFRIGQNGLRVFAPKAAAHVRTPPVVAPDARLSVGVAAIDEMLGGGLPRGFSLLVAGPSGSGKSVLGASFLAAGAAIGETGVIAAFERNPALGVNRALAEQVAAGTLAVIDTAAPDLSMDEVLMSLTAEIRRLRATRVVLDSLTGFELALAPTFRTDFRESLLQLVAALIGEGVTVLMTCELEDRYTDLRFSPYGNAFMTDAIIVQRYIEVESRLRRMLAVVKVRGSAHSDALREFTIDENGIQIGEVLSGQEGLLGGRPTRVAQTTAHDETVR